MKYLDIATNITTAMVALLSIMDIYKYSSRKEMPTRRSSIADNALIALYAIMIVLYRVA